MNNGPLDRGVAAHVLAMHLAAAFNGDEVTDSHCLYPCCSQVMATLENQGYVLHGELPASDTHEGTDTEAPVERSVLLHWSALLHVSSTEINSTDLSDVFRRVAKVEREIDELLAAHGGER